MGTQRKKRMKNKSDEGMVWEGFLYHREKKHTHPFHMEMLWTISKKSHNGIEKKKNPSVQMPPVLIIWNKS